MTGGVLGTQKNQIIEIVHRVSTIYVLLEKSEIADTHSYLVAFK